MATLRNRVIGMLCQAEPVNLAAALRHPARDPARPLTTLGILLRSSPHERTFRENAGALPVPMTGSHRPDHQSLPRDHLLYKALGGATR
jgi:hypothetical protein